MPRLLADSPADRLTARIIAAYLTGSDAAAPDAADPAHPAPQADRGKTLYTGAGCAACHEVPNDDTTDPARVSATPALAKLGRKWKPAGLAHFLQNPLETRPHGRMPSFGFSATEAADLAAYLLQRDAAAGPATAQMEKPSDKELAQEWRKLTGDKGKLPEAAQLLPQVALRTMAARGCLDCHDHDTRGSFSITRTASGAARISANVEPRAIRPAAVAPALVGLSAARFESGCLAPEAKLGPAPRFALLSADRAALRAYLLTLSQASTASSMDRLRVDLAALNCLRCHSNEGQGGQSLSSLLGGGEAALHNMPPLLNGAGQRVNADHLRAWLTGGAGTGALRPWVGAKMPGFGPLGGRVADELAARDGATGPAPLAGAAAPSIAAPNLEPKHLAVGRTLVGTKAPGLHQLPHVARQVVGQSARSDDSRAGSGQSGRPSAR